MTITWGEAIPILDGKRPEWLSEDEMVLPHWQLPPPAWSCFAKTGIEWEFTTHTVVDMIKLPASHPYYQTKEPNMTKIDEALVERMVKLVEGVATKVLDGAAIHKIRVEAYAIASLLPKPVDPEKEAVRKAMAWSWGYEDNSAAWDQPGYTPYHALAGFRAGREYQKEQG